MIKANAKASEPARWGLVQVRPLLVAQAKHLVFITSSFPFSFQFLFASLISWIFIWQDLFFSFFSFSFSFST